MATRITKVLKRFLDYHNIPVDKILDAKGMTPSAYKEKMATENYWAAIGVAPCSQGHTVKTKCGRCPICSPSTFGYSMRYRKPGRIYLAYSCAGGVAKFGYSTNVAGRIRHLNGHGCGGQKDWGEIGSFLADDAASIEEDIP